MWKVKTCTCCSNIILPADPSVFISSVLSSLQMIEGIVVASGRRIWVWRRARVWRVCNHNKTLTRHISEFDHRTKHMTHVFARPQTNFFLTLGVKGIIILLLLKMSYIFNNLLSHFLLNINHNLFYDPFLETSREIREIKTTFWHNACKHAFFLKVKL